MSARNNDTSDNDSLGSDIEFVDRRIIFNIVPGVAGKAASTSVRGVRLIDTPITVYVDHRDERLLGGATPAYGADDMSITSISSAGEEDEAETDLQAIRQKKRNKYMRIVKICVLLGLWVIFTSLLLITAEHEHSKSNFICVPNVSEKIFHVPEESTSAGFFITVTGPFIMFSKEELLDRGNEKNTLTIKLLQSSGNGTQTHDVSKHWVLNLANKADLQEIHIVKRAKLFTLRHLSESASKKLQVSFTTNIAEPLSLEFYYEPTPVNLKTGIIIALLLIIGFYILLMLDIVHRAVAVIVFCTLAISMLAVLNLRPTLRTIIDWIHFEVLLLLFAFTLIIAIAAESGIIDYLTVRIYEISNGHVWPILNCLCLITLIGSSLFDSILMMLLVAPITMRVCEVMELNPVPLLTCLIISSNVGATLTPNGQTPSDYVTRHEVLRREGIDWLVFVEHILPGTLIAGASAYLYMRFNYHDSNSMRFRDGAEVERLRRVIKVWSRTAKSISPYSQDEKAMRYTVLSKVRRLRRRLKRIGKMPTPASDYKDTLRTLKLKFQITDTVLLIKCYFVFFFAFALILLHLFPNVHYLSTAWTALLACILMLILANTEDFDGILGRIEWSSMLFLSCIFVFSEAITRLGLFDGIGKVAGHLIMYSNSNARLAIAIFIVLWCSAFCAAFLTDSAVSSLMLRAVIIAIEESEDEYLPVQPLVWAVILGTGLGGIGTIIGTCTNVICAGLAEKHGYNFPFLYYCKVGFPIMLVCVLSMTVYLMIAHVLCHWH